MKTTITYTDGKVEEYPDVAPSINLEVNELVLVDKEMITLGNELELRIVKQVLFEM